LIWALSYAQRGLPVLPVYGVTGEDMCWCGRVSCHSPGKHPMTEHGLDDATTDEATIRGWWERWPEANVGVRLPPGVLVIDVDPRNGGATALLELCRAHGGGITGLTPTLTAHTGGGGLHAWYAYRGPIRARLASGIDLKGQGTGYVVMPPSRHVSGEVYSWVSMHAMAPLPAWLRHLVCPAPPPTPRAVRRTAGERRPTGDGLVATVLYAVEGNRNRALHWAACRAVEDGETAQLEDLVTAAVSAGLPEREARTTVRSAQRTHR